MLLLIIQLKSFLGFYFSKLYQSTSYAVAVDTHSLIFDGMYINPYKPILSFRTSSFDNKNILIIAGLDHKTGFSPNFQNPYEHLFSIAKKHFPNAELLYKWNTEDCISLDKIPYIGSYSNNFSDVYVATGFNKWGMTSSNVAANIITDKILNTENKFSFVFNSLRLSPLKNRIELKNMTNQTFKSFVINKIKIPHSELFKIKNDNGAIINLNGTHIGIYKDFSGNIFAVKPNCSHLGCLLTWNNLDKTWDCPCHGSRFDYTGKSIYDPAFKSLKRYDIINK